MMKQTSPRGDSRPGPEEKDPMMKKQTSPAPTSCS